LFGNCISIRILISQLNRVAALAEWRQFKTASPIAI
jgi:hypothetical protein